MARSSRLLRFGWVGVVVAMLVSVVAVAPVGAAPPSSCEFFENPDGSFEVSWSETAPNAVIVSRTNNGDGPFWRGRVDAPGLSFSDSSSWAAVVGYQIQHQVGGVNSDYIECVEVDPPGAGGGPSSCEFFENPDGSFEVSWDQTVPDAVIVSRTNNGAGPYWRGRVDAPGLSFSDGSSWSSQTTYQIQHQVGGVNSDYIECVEVDPPGAGGGPSSCEFFENPDGSFEVSWDQTVPDAVIVSRTNNGDGPFWRGRVDAPGLSFSDSSSWASVVGYQIQHQVGGVNSDYIDCSLSGEPPAPPTVPTTCEYRAGPASTLSFDIGPDYAAFPEVTSQVIQERLGDGDWVDKASVTAAGTGYAIDRPATSPASYRIDARDGAGETVGVAECGPTVPPNLSPRPFNDAVGGPVSDYLSLDHLTQFEADGVTGSGNRCDIPDGYSLWQWDKPFTMTFPNAQATVQLALWLPAAPEGFHYQVWVDATVSRVPHGPGWAGGSMPYDFGLSDTEGRLQDNTEMGYRGPGEQVFDLERNGWKTEAGFGFSNGGYVRVYFRNYFGSTSGVASTWDLFGPGKYQIYMVPEGTVVDPADRDNYTSIQPQPNPCLGFYAPDEPGLSYPELQISEENTLSWREALGYAWEAAVWVNNEAVIFAPGFDCLEAIRNGVHWGNSTFCLLDLAPIVGSFDEAVLLASRADDLILEFRKGDEILTTITNAHPIDDLITACTRLGSFGPDTGVLMADGTVRPISSVGVGDSVVSQDAENGELTTGLVSAVNNHSDDLYALSYGDGSVLATRGHPIWSATERTWLTANGIVGHNTLAATGDLLSVNELSTVAESTDAYDLSVDGWPNFFIVNTAGQSALVHNSNCSRLDISFGEDLVPLYRRDRSNSNFVDYLNQNQPFPEVARFDEAVSDFGARINEIVAGTGQAIGQQGPRGIYVLYDELTGEIVRTGRGVLDSRQVAHAANPDLSDFEFAVVAYTDDYNQLMGLERLAYDATEASAAAANGGYNYVVPVGSSHPFYNFFNELGVRIVEAAG